MVLRLKAWESRSLPGLPSPVIREFFLQTVFLLQRTAALGRLPLLIRRDPERLRPAPLRSRPDFVF
jgi:hypothetical protein